MSEPPYAGHVPELEKAAAAGDSRAAAKLLGIYRRCNGTYHAAELEDAIAKARDTRVVRKADGESHHVSSEMSMEPEIASLLVAPSERCRGVPKMSEQALAPLVKLAVTAHPFPAMEEGLRQQGEGNLLQARAAYATAWQQGFPGALRRLSELAGEGVPPFASSEESLSADALAYAYLLAYLEISQAIMTSPGPIARRALAAEREHLASLEDQVFPHERPAARAYAARIVDSNDACCVF